jgi:hypothetical protein
MVAALQADLAIAMAEIHHMRSGRLFRWASVYWRLRYRVQSLFRRPANRAQ